MRGNPVWSLPYLWHHRCCVRPRVLTSCSREINSRLIKLEGERGRFDFNFSLS